MKKGKAIRDTQVKAIKTFLKESNFELKQTNNPTYSELDGSVAKIVNLRKYKKNIWSEHFIYEIDVVVDMRIVNDYYMYSNAYCERNKRKCNSYYRNKISKAIENEIKYFGFDTFYDVLNVIKKTYKKIV